jgi:DNA-binding NarL/FixJ family response regulator
MLMDVRLPDGSGVEACHDILALLPTTRVIFLTSFADDELALAAVLAGAQGYVLKNIDSGLLVRSIRYVFNGQSLLSPALTQRALARLKAMPAQADPVRTQSLAPQEERVLALVAEGLTNKEIGAALQLSDKTVKNYLSNMFQKLHITRRSQAATFFVKRQS